MKGFILRWFMSSLALLAVTYIVKGIQITNITTVFVAALILGIINAFLRPLIILVTLVLPQQNGHLTDSISSLKLCWTYVPQR